MRLRLAELIGALSLATDLGLGLPQEHVAAPVSDRARAGGPRRPRRRRARRGLLRRDARLGRVHRGLPRARGAVRGRDRAARAAYEIDLAGLPMIGFMLRPGRYRPAALRRARMAADAGGRAAGAAPPRHDRPLPGGLGDARAARARARGADPLLHVFARWDRKGVPEGVGGKELPWRCASSSSPTSSRCATAAAASTARSRSRASARAASSTRARRGVRRQRRRVLGGLEDESSWDAVIAAEPGLASRSPATSSTRR